MMDTATPPARRNVSYEGGFDVALTQYLRSARIYKKLGRKPIKKEFNRRDRKERPPAKAKRRAGRENALKLKPKKKRFFSASSACSAVKVFRPPLQWFDFRGVFS